MISIFVEYNITDGISDKSGNFLSYSQENVRHQVKNIHAHSEQFLVICGLRDIIRFIFKKISVFLLNGIFIKQVRNDSHEDLQFECTNMYINVL